MAENCKTVEEHQKLFYEAHKLLAFCNREFTRYLWHMFVTERWSHYRNKLHTQSGSDVVTQLAVDFHAYLVDAHEANTGSVDEHLKMIAGFILIVNNLRDFIDSY